MQISKEYLESKGCFKTGHPAIVASMVNAMSPDVPKGLATVVVINALTHLISGFRNLIITNTTSKNVTSLIPTNTFTFALAPSGVSKDRTKNTARDMLAGGYEVLTQYIKNDNIERAKLKAIREGGDEDDYGKYLKPPRSLEIKFGTSQGVNQSISDIGNYQQVGIPNIISSEIGADLGSRRDSITSVFTTLSDGYDIGTLEFDTVRTQEAKIKGVTSLPINFLVFGSEQGILLDQTIKNSFKSIFSQQLARRCWFFYTSKVPEVTLPNTIEERIQLKLKEEEIKGKNQDLVYTAITALCGIMPIGQNIVVDPEVDILFNVYQTYNVLYSDTIHPSLPISKLSRKHKQWLAFKLAGVYCMLDNPKALKMEVEHYVAAINTVESLSESLLDFERELSKEKYEVLYTHCKSNCEAGNKMSISFHELKKLKFIEGSGAKAKVNELVTLLNSYSKDIFTVEEDHLVFERVLDIDIVGVSVISLDTSRITEITAQEDYDKIELSSAKSEVARKTVWGYEFLEAPFSDYDMLLKASYVYTPFQFKTSEQGAVYDKTKHPDVTGGIRGRDNILGGCKFVVLDVDTSNITDEEAHFLLSDINHHIARTSDPTNPFKFRLLIELDMVVSLDPQTWKYFLVEIEKTLGITLDTSAQAQVYNSYSSPVVLSVTDAEPLEVKPLLIACSEKRATKIEAPLTDRTKQSKLKNKFDTFAFAFGTAEGGRNNAFVRAIYTAKNLGATKEYTIGLLKEINEYILDKMSEDELERNLISQVERWD